MTAFDPVAKLSSLTPTEFENLTYDTLRAVGLKNLVWRTPGADGGRDIEGIAYAIDPTGHETTLRWYVECKRYQASIDWPTIWKKIAYADANGADVFLLSTNSNPSPDCETEIAKWNDARRRPLIRMWRGYEWRNLLATFPDIALSYGVGTPREPQDSIKPIATILTKVVQSAYMATQFDLDASSALSASAALSELITKRLSELSGIGRFIDLADSLVVDKALAISDDSSSPVAVSGWDDISLRAMLAFVRYATGTDVLRIREVADGVIRGRLSSKSKNGCFDADTQTIGRWSRLHLSLDSERAEFELSKYEH